jgi:putative molybdopterin biosynthesis protein
MVHLSIAYKFSDQPTRNRVEHPLVDVLESIQETGSIAQAAKNMRRSFRSVWGELKHWESELNAQLIIWGRTGKGAELTPQALQFLRAVSESHLELERPIAQIKSRMETCLCILKNSATSH